LIIITGPQDTDEAVGFLAEMAGLHEAIPSWAAVLQWATATALYCLIGWDRCPLAVADVTMAKAAGMAIYYLAV
jgi:hypothetical protein